MILGGFGAPLFLFLAGVSVALSAGSKLRRGLDPKAASGAVVKRGLQIFGLAFLFRVQAMVVSWGPWRSLLKVDILNIMGPAIMAAAALWGAMKTTRGRLIAFALATLALTFLTPPVRATSILAVLPDFLEGYLRPRPGFTNFAIFPWAGFVFAGGFIGVLLDEARSAPVERRLNAWFARGGRVARAGVLRRLPLPEPVSQLRVLDVLAVLLPPPHRPARHHRRGRLPVASPSTGRDRLQSAAAARADVAVHLLDPHRADLRADGEAAAQVAHARPGVDWRGGLRGADADGVAAEGASSGGVESRRMPGRELPSS